MEVAKTVAAQPKATPELYISAWLTLPGPALVNKDDSEKVDLLRNCDTAAAQVTR